MEYFNTFELSPQQKKEYQELGYVNLGKTLTDRGTEAMLHECMDAWNKEKSEYHKDKTWLQNSLLTHIHHHSSLVRDFYFRGPFVKIASELIGPNIKGVASQLTFKMLGNTKTFGWHQDNGYGELNPYNALTTLTALEDVNEENGCIRLIPGSHKQGQINLANTYNISLKHDQQAIELIVEESSAISVPMLPGETLIFNCFLLHQSRGNFSKTRNRRILFLRYADADVVEVYNGNKPRLGKLLLGKTKFPAVEQFEKELN